MTTKADTSPLASFDLLSAHATTRAAKEGLPAESGATLHYRGREDASPSERDVIAALGCVRAEPDSAEPNRRVRIVVRRTGDKRIEVTFTSSNRATASEILAMAHRAELEALGATTTLSSAETPRGATERGREPTFPNPSAVRPPSKE